MQAFLVAKLPNARRKRFIWHKFTHAYISLKSLQANHLFSCFFLVRSFSITS